MPYVMVYYLANTSFVQSAGLILIERSGTAAPRVSSPADFVRDLCKKPPILAVVFSLVLLAVDLTLPQPIMRFAGYIADSVSPLALIYCGYIIYELGLRNVRLMRGLPAMMVVRLGVSPAICWLFCHFFGIEGLAMQVFVVKSALPVVSQVTVLAGAFGADERYAATGACLSTLGSFITIPVLMLVLG